MTSRWWFYPALIAVSLVFVAAGVGALTVVLLWPNLPSLEVLTDYRPKIPLRIYSDIVLTSQMLVEPADPEGAVYLLPARTRYEQKDGGTETSTERRVIFSPHVPGHDCEESKAHY